MININVTLLILPQDYQWESSPVGTLHFSLLGTLQLKEPAMGCLCNLPCLQSLHGLLCQNCLPHWAAQLQEILLRYRYFSKVGTFLHTTFYCVENNLPWLEDMEKTGKVVPLNWQKPGYRSGMYCLANKTFHYISVHFFSFEM